MPEGKSKFERSKDFSSTYANNIVFQSTAWDLQMIFGELDVNRSLIEQRAAVTLTWPQARIAAYFLLFNAILFEADHGPISIPNALVPPRLDPTDRALERVAHLHDLLFGTTRAETEPAAPSSEVATVQ